MPGTIALPSPAHRHRLLTYENDPAFGDYIYSSGSAGWTQRRAFTDGRPLLLCGRGRKPTAEQIAFWTDIENRIDEVTAVAVASVGPPPEDAQPELPRRTLAFSQDELVLREVRLCDANSFELFFNTPTGDQIDMWPFVTFNNWRITAWEWAP